MTTVRTCRALACSATLLASGVAVADDVLVRSDPGGDAILRRTDPGNDGAVDERQTLPDLLSLSLSGWLPANPTQDPYTGQVVPGQGAHLVRIDLQLRGLVTPPGTLGLNGQSYNPFVYGPNPLFGFVEINVDNDQDTGGELSGATYRFLANAARFGGRPQGPIGARAVSWRQQVDDTFETAPQYERSGADFALVFCGCFNTSIVNAGGDGDSTFEPGETWIVRGRFFQRAGGYRDASGMSGGSDFGLYDPWVRVRFAHATATNTTTVTLVYPIDMFGASMLTGQPEQPIDQFIDGGNHSSVVEAIQDVIDGADGLNGGELDGPTRELAIRWRGRDATDYLDPTTWTDVSALVGTTYLVREPTLYAWTDVGFRWQYADVDGDGSSDGHDRVVVESTLDSQDGGPFDADGARDGRVSVAGFAAGYTLYDLDYNGVIDQADVDYYQGNGDADWNDDGVVNSDDFFDFFNDFNGNNADFNGDGRTDVDDFFDFLNAYYA